MLEYLLSLAIIALVWSLLVQSYNLSFGLTGLFNLGHIVFYGVGAYTAAILNTKYGFNFFVNIPLAALIAGSLAAFFGLVTLRLSGHYLAIATLGAAMIAQVVATNWMALTNGPLGIRGIEDPILGGFNFDTSWRIFALYAGMTIICHFLLWKIFNSPFGRLQRAIQDDEIAVQSLGKNTFQAKAWSLIISGAFAGVAGALYVHYRLFLDPTIFALP
ncbi:MAG TPA: branched-chain amino acid ABC transporter permease, partial [Candidatus Gracilibacteria bacterium]